MERCVGTALGLDAAGVAELMDELWVEYVGRLNEELAEYFASLRPRYRTGILSNSFVGAREREQAPTASRTCATWSCTPTRRG